MSFSGISNEHNSARNKEDNDRVIDPEFAILSHINIAASVCAAAGTNFNFSPNPLREHWQFLVASLKVTFHEDPNLYECPRNGFLQKFSSTRSCLGRHSIKLSYRILSSSGSGPGQVRVRGTFLDFKGV